MNWKLLLLLLAAGGAVYYFSQQGGSDRESKYTVILNYDNGTNTNLRALLGAMTDAELNTYFDFVQAVNRNEVTPQLEIAITPIFRKYQIQGT